MKEFNAEAIRLEPASALETVRQVEAERRYPAYIGLDVHKETIVVAVARAGREAAHARREIANKTRISHQGSEFWVNLAKQVDRSVAEA